MMVMYYKLSEKGKITVNNVEKVLKLAEINTNGKAEKLEQNEDIIVLMELMADFKEEFNKKVEANEILKEEKVNFLQITPNESNVFNFKSAYYSFINNHHGAIMVTIYDVADDKEARLIDIITKHDNSLYSSYFNCKIDENKNKVIGGWLLMRRMFLNHRLMD